MINWFRNCKWVYKGIMADNVKTETASPGMDYQVHKFQHKIHLRFIVN